MKYRLISVVLCNYNYGVLIADTMESVFNQDYSNFELIVIDDGSTDNSRQIISDYTERYPELLRPIYKENEGQAVGFNLGVELAKGEIICFLDSDDLWLPGKLAMVNRWFNEKDDIGLLQHNMNIMRGNLKTDELFRDALLVGDVRNHTQQTRQVPLFVPTSGLCFSKKVLERVMPIPRAFRTCADGFLTRTSMCFGMVYAELKSYGFYRLHAENSVFGNTGHSNSDYVNNLLRPHLETFYRDNKINIAYAKPKYRLQHNRTFTKLNHLKPHRRILASMTYEKFRNWIADVGVLIDPTDRKLKTMQGRYSGKSCHVLGRTCKYSKDLMEKLKDSFVFIADTNAIHEWVGDLTEGIYCISDLRFWDRRSPVSPNMQKFLSSIRHLFKMFERPARLRSTQLPAVEYGTYLFKTVDRDYSIWKGFVTEDCTKRLSWGYHVVLDMCIPMALHLGFKRIFLHGCSWDRGRETESMGKFITLMGGGNHYNLSENFLPYDTPYGRLELLWKKSFEVIKRRYASRGVVISTA